MPNGQSLKYLNEWTELWRLTDTLYDRQLKRWGAEPERLFRPLPAAGHTRRCGTDGHRGQSQHSPPVRNRSSQRF